MAGRAHEHREPGSHRNRRCVCVCASCKIFACGVRYAVACRLKHIAFKWATSYAFHSVNRNSSFRATWAITPKIIHTRLEYELRHESMHRCQHTLHKATTTKEYEGKKTHTHLNTVGTREKWMDIASKKRTQKKWRQRRRCEWVSNTVQKRC